MDHVPQTAFAPPNGTAYFGFTIYDLARRT